MALVPLGQTTHFVVEYENTSGPAALGVANTLLGTCEGDLARLNLYMPSGTFFIDPQIKIQVLNDPVNGPPLASGKNTGFHGTDIPRVASVIQINPYSAPGVQITDDFAAFVFVAEMAEILAGIYGWDLSSSQGEALSRVMAEELHPASASVWVNPWLSLPRPRPDWISRNEATTALVRADLDQIAYGCGIIFIYFLRYQLGVTYDAICMTPGPTLADRYKKLLSATDDPAGRLGALLDKHFGSGAISLAGNNPFPLYDAAARKVVLSFGKPTIAGHIIRELSGNAHVQPFFNCPAKDYPYYTLGDAV
ncbi:MAG: hypothetical protein JOZ59_03330, partial [Candidatus Eremiobacteraeota bacterium]|nr:hypothetical protein [Candidatus Eremiobacteraeota bacterium]